MAAGKLRPLLRRLRSATPAQSRSIRNEYYWFSQQPRKQYDLGREFVAKGIKAAYYCQGVGAAQLAKKYGLACKSALAIRWAKRSEKAWLKYFEVRPDWFNSYFFYAMALAFQGRHDQAEAALARACKIAGKSMRWQAIKEIQADIVTVVAKLERGRPQ